MIRIAAKPAKKAAAQKPEPAIPGTKRVSAKPTPSTAEKRGPGRPKGSGKGKSPDAKVPLTIRLGPDVLAKWKAKGVDWRQLIVELVTKSV